MLLDEQNTKTPRLVLLDGHAMVFRAFFALSKDRPMTVKETGERIEAVYSFTSTLFKAINDLSPSHLAIAFDPRGPTFRHEEYREYKGTRAPTPTELPHQIDRVKEVVTAMGIPVYEIPGYEADDVLGTISKQASDEGAEIIIYTGDTDTLQLVKPNVKVLITSGFGDQRVFDEDAVRQRYGGLDPIKQIDVKALEGDTSDNIPGVPGIGRKTAIKLIDAYGSLDGVYQNIDRVTPPRIQSLLKEYENDARQSKYLVTIVTSVDTKFELEQTEFGNFERENLVHLFRELGFTSLVDRIPQLNKRDSSTYKVNLDASSDSKIFEGSTPDTDVTVIDNKESFERMIEQLSAAPFIALDTEASSINPMQADLAGLSFSTTPGKAFYVPLGHLEGEQLGLDYVFDSILPLLHKDSSKLVGHNLNYDLTLLSKYGVDPKQVSVQFDTLIAAHLLGERGLGLKQLALSKLGIEMTLITELIGKGRNQITFNEVPIQSAAPYAGADADISLRLKDQMEKDLDQQSLTLMKELEMPLVPVLVEMQANGISLDQSILQNLSTEISAAILQAETLIFKVVGHQFNIGSPQQLSDVLFKELNLPTGRKTLTGFSTDASTLEGLLDTHPIVSQILSYRELTKLRSTYVDSLPNQINPATMRIHTTFNQVGASTGRLASNDPNLQNIPVRTDLGRRVRDAFIAGKRPEWLLLAADYSQVELRVLAHLSGDPALIEAFENGEDIHSSTASLVYKVPIEKVGPEMRRLAKVMNFGVIYGLSAFGIANQTELTMEEGAQFISTYMGTYPRVKEYLDETLDSARQLGYVETILGRRRYLPEITSTNRQLRQASERMAVNMPVQGTAADIVKAAMVEIQARLIQEKMRSTMLLQVHDELVFETPKEEVPVLCNHLEEIMPRALNMVVPLLIEIKKGESWGTMAKG